jgi:hypothetical protein
MSDKLISKLKEADGYDLKGLYGKRNRENHKADGGGIAGSNICLV